MSSANARRTCVHVFALDDLIEYEFQKYSELAFPQKIMYWIAVEVLSLRAGRSFNSMESVYCALTFKHLMFGILNACPSRGTGGGLEYLN